MAENSERQWTPSEWRKEFVLPTWQRGLLAVVGTVLILLACKMYVAPPEHSVTEHYPGNPINEKITTTPIDSPALVIAAFGIGLGFIAWAINGFKIRSFEGMGVKVDVPAVEQPGRLANTPRPIDDQAEFLAGVKTGFTVATASDVAHASGTAEANVVPSQGSTLGDTEQYLPGQTGINKTHTYLLRSSWHALKLLKACQVAKAKGKPISLREISALTNMSFDYTYGYFIASYSADVISGAADPSTGLAKIFDIQPTLAAKIDEVIVGNFGVMPSLEDQKRQEYAALLGYLGKL